jgi:carbonic anhydrase/acetyltransferase-like protein (isoleucine patch superfamily)
MRTLIGVGAALLIAVTIGVWSSAGTQSTVAKATLVSSTSPVAKATRTPAMSVWEIHNQAHLENLPVQDVDDLTFVFTGEHVASK